MLARNAGDRVHADELLELIAELEVDMKHYADAARDAQTVLTSATQIEDIENVVSSAAALGRAEIGQGNRAKAEAAFETTEAAMERMRDDAAGSSKERSDFFAQRPEVYQELAEIDVEQAKVAEALLISEREKGRALLDLMTEGKSGLSSELSVAEKEEETHLRSSMVALEATRARSALATPVDTVRLAAQDKQLDESRTAINAFRERMYAVHPRLSQHRGDAALISLD